MCNWNPSSTLQLHTIRLPKPDHVNISGPIDRKFSIPWVSDTRNWYDSLEWTEFTMTTISQIRFTYLKKYPPPFEKRCPPRIYALSCSKRTYVVIADTHSLVNSRQSIPIIATMIFIRETWATIQVMVRPTAFTALIAFITFITFITFMAWKDVRGEGV